MEGAPEAGTSLLAVGCQISGAGDGYCQPHLGGNTSHLTGYPVSPWVRRFVFGMALPGFVASADCQIQHALVDTGKHWVCI